jgi:hypothetical protein
VLRALIFFPRQILLSPRVEPSLSMPYIRVQSRNEEANPTIAARISASHHCSNHFSSAGAEWSVPIAGHARTCDSLHPQCPCMLPHIGALPDRTLDRTGLPLVAPIFLQQIGKPIFILIHLVNLVMHGRANLVNWMNMHNHVNLVNWM